MLITVKLFKSSKKKLWKLVEWGASYSLLKLYTRYMKERKKEEEQCTSN